MKPTHAAFIPLMFAHWVGWKVSLIYILLLIISIVLAKLIKGRLRINKIAIGILAFCAVFFGANLIHLFDQSADIAIVFSNLNLFLSLFLIVAIILFSQPWTTLEISNVARAIFWIAFYSLILEFFAVNFLGISKELMPGVRYSHSYFMDFMGWHRPFGLTGQSSANGGILIISFLLLTELKIVDAKAIWALLLGVLVTISGQAILSAVLILALLQLNRTRSWLAKSMAILNFCLLVAVLLYIDLFGKTSLEYLFYVLLEKAHFNENVGILNGWQVLFGTMGSVETEENYGSEVFLIQSIKLFGVVFTTAFWLFVWFLVKKARLRFIWFIGCFATSLHYPTIYYIEAQLPLALLYLSTLRNSIPLLPKNIQVAKPTFLPYSARRKSA